STLLSIRFFPAVRTCKTSLLSIFYSSAGDMASARQNTLLYNLIFLHEIHSPAAAFQAFSGILPSGFPDLLHIASQPHDPGCRQQDRMLFQICILSLHIAPVRERGLGYGSSGFLSLPALAHRLKGDIAAVLPAEAGISEHTAFQQVLQQILSVRRQ